MRCVPPQPTCSLSGRSRKYNPTPDVVSWLVINGHARGLTMVDMAIGWQCRAGATVIDTKFVAGEPLAGVRRAGWSNRRCGSVITTIIGGRSYYGLVGEFIERVDGTGLKFAVVSWLPRPSYPYPNNPTVVRLRDVDVCPGLPGCVSIFDIDPTSVGVSRCDEEGCLYVYRMRGVDPVPTIL